MRKRKNLKNRLVQLFVLIVFVCILALLVINYWSTWDFQNRQFFSYNHDLLKLSAENFNLSLNQVLDISLTPYKEDNFYDKLISKETDFNTNYEIKTALHSMLKSSSSIAQVYLYSSSKEIEYLARDAFVSHQMSNTTHDDPTNLINQINITCGKLDNHGFAFSKSQDINVITLSRTLYSFPENKYIGDLYIDFFFNIAQKDEFNSDRVFGFIPGDSDQLFDLEGNILEIDISRTMFTESNGVVENDLYTVFYHSVQPNVGMSSSFIVSIYPTATVHKSAISLAKRNLIVGLLMMVITCLVMAHFASSFTEPFVYIENQLAKIAKGNLNIKMDLKREDEFGVFATHFNEMINSINNLIINEYQTRIENKNTQLKALQAQLNPHFINNTIQNFGAEALINNNKKLYMALLEFGKMMRYTMDFQKMEVSFHEELEYTKNYISLQSLRFKDKYTYNMDIASDSLGVKVPRLLLQPLVENIYKHSSSNDKKRITVTISTHVNNKVFILSCKNDGNSLNPNELKKIQELIILAKHTNDESAHIGLINLSRRLQLVYGDNASIRVDSNEENGFEVEIIINMQEDKA